MNTVNDQELYQRHLLREGRQQPLRRYKRVICRVGNQVTVPAQRHDHKAEGSDSIFPERVYQFWPIGRQHCLLCIPWLIHAASFRRPAV